MSETLRVLCPDCGSVLGVDAATGAVLRHEPPASQQKLGSLEEAAREVARRRERAEDLFAATVDREKRRSEILEKTFKDAMERVKTEPPGRPPSPFDRD